MKREINLLPPAFQLQRRHIQYARGARGLLRHVAAGVFGVGVIVAATYGTLRLIAADLTMRAPDTTQATNEAEAKIIEANELLAAIESRQAASVLWTESVREILPNMPDELTLTQISVDEKQNLSLTGVARSRDSVVEFEQILRELPWVQRVDAPLQNFATGGTAKFILVVTRKSTAP